MPTTQTLLVIACMSGFFVVVALFAFALAVWREGLRRFRHAA